MDVDECSNLAADGVVTPKEYKEVEGQRIAPVLAAIAALPAAGLLTLKAPGAPIFIVALAFIAAAYVFWLFGDAVYHAYFGTSLSEEPSPKLMSDFSQHCQYATFGYAVASVMTSFLGLAAHHSTLRSPLSVELGFIVGIFVAGAVASHAFWALQKRSACEDLVIADAKAKNRRVTF